MRPWCVEEEFDAAGRVVPLMIRELSRLSPRSSLDRGRIGREGRLGDPSFVDLSAGMATEVGMVGGRQTRIAASARLLEREAELRGT